MAPSTTASLSAKVANDPSSNPQVNWTATCGSNAQCGSFNPNLTGSEVATSYTSPGGIAAGTNITVTATSGTDPTRSVSAKIEIEPPISIEINPTVPATLPTSASIPLSARISNDPSGSPQVQWSAICGSSACGSFSSATTGNGVSTTYTAPSAVPAGGNISVTATSVTDPTKSASASIAIVAAAPSASLPDGSYVYQIYGADGTAVAGVFKAAGGLLVGGEQDYSTDNSTGGYYNVLEQISGGTYNTTADGNLKIALQFSDGTSLAFESSPAPHGQGFIAGQFVYATQFSGTLNLQTNTAPPAAGYAVSLLGSDVNDDQVWLAGVLNIDQPIGLNSSGGISGSGSVLDVHYSGYTSDTALTVLPGTVSSPDQYGRVVIQLNSVSPSNGGEAFYMASYPIDATDNVLIEAANGDTYVTGPTSINGVMSGVGRGQGTATGKFTASSLAGSSYVFAANSVPIAPVAGVFTAKSGGSLSGTLNWNNGTGKLAQSPLPFTGTYTVEATGRVTLSNLSGTGFSYNMYLYLTGNGRGIVLSNDPTNIFLGQAIQQQATPFNSSSLNGKYELNNSGVPFIADGPAVIGTVTATSSGGIDHLIGVADSSNNKIGLTISGDFTPASDGVFTGTLTGLNQNSPKTTDNFTLYLVDDTQGFAIETDSAGLSLVHLQVP